MVSRRPRRLAAPAAVAAAFVAALAALLAARDAAAVVSTRPHPHPTYAPTVPIGPPTEAPLEPPTKSPTKSPVSNERCTLRTCGKQLPSGCYCDEQVRRAAGCLSERALSQTAAVDQNTDLAALCTHHTNAIALVRIYNYTPPSPTPKYSPPPLSVCSAT